MLKQLLIFLLICAGGTSLCADSFIPQFKFVVDTAGARAPASGPEGPGEVPAAPRAGAVAPAARRPAAPVYGVGSSGGVWISLDGGRNWLDRSAGLPVRIVYPFDGSLIRRLGSLSYNPLDPAQVAVASAYALYVSPDTGGSWREIQVSHPVKSVDHITAVCVSPQDENTIYIGTSFSGYFKTTDGGNTWQSEKESIKHLYLGAGFYETIAAIAVSPVDRRRVYLAVGTDGQILETSDSGRNWRSMGITGGMIRALSFVREDETGAWVTRAHGDGAVFVYSDADDRWIPERGGVSVILNQQLTTAKSRRLQIAAGRTGIYVNTGWAAGEALESHLRLLAEHGMDTIVVDMKDDFGRVPYDSKLSGPKEVGAIHIRFDLDELLARAHAAGIYVVGRIVVFQDPKLYAYKGNAYAVWNSKTGEPWGNRIPAYGSDGKVTGYEQREFWVDPHSEFVWRYNIAIADEITARGVDEVQFDYIRFPSDGDTSLIQYRFRRDGMSRADAIESFLALAREHVEVPISADLYGFNAWYLMGGWIGQNIDVVADYVEVVCPMFYPSHFPGSFLSGLDYFDRARTIYLTGSNRAASLVGGRSIVRPYVQAFLIGGERRFETEEYTRYLAQQLEGVTSSRASGFSLWNASNIYYMVSESLKRFTTPGR